MTYHSSFTSLLLYYRKNRNKTPLVENPMASWYGNFSQPMQSMSKASVPSVRCSRRFSSDSANFSLPLTSTALRHRRKKRYTVEILCADFFTHGRVLPHIPRSENGEIGSERRGHWGLPKEEVVDKFAFFHTFQPQYAWILQFLSRNFGNFWQKSRVKTQLILLIDKFLRYYYGNDIHVVPVN